mmetsp:Transcript_5961/g.12482  ORF Transcript_5961/g.12482 Transcript_5961/m.12482 type:complete len:100 (-) Transcript_5961:69-368(-)
MCGVPAGFLAPLGPTPPGGRPLRAILPCDPTVRRQCDRRRRAHTLSSDVCREDLGRTEEDRPSPLFRCVSMYPSGEKETCGTPLSALLHVDTKKCTLQR